MQELEQKLDDHIKETQDKMTKQGQLFKKLQGQVREGGGKGSTKAKTDQDENAELQIVR